MNFSLMQRWGATAVAATLALALSACGGDDGSGSEQAGGEPAAAASDSTPAPVAGGSEVVVLAKDIAFEPTNFTIGAAPTKVTLKNEGAIPHSLVIEGAPNAARLEVTSNGESDSATLDLAPGTYTAYCDQPGHRAAGMETKLTVG